MGSPAEPRRDPTRVRPAAPPLSDFRGGGIYLDAMMLVGFLDNQSRWYQAACDLFDRVVDPETPVRGITASLTIDEVVSVLLRELVARPPYSVTTGRAQFLAGHPEAVSQLMIEIEATLRSLVDLVSVQDVLAEDLPAMFREMTSTGLMPRDAIHVAVMRRLGLTAVASADPAFDRCEGLIRYAP